MGTLRRLKQCERTLELSLGYIRDHTTVIPFPYQTQFYQYFFAEGNRLHGDILDLLKVEDVDRISRFLFLMSTLSGQINDELTGANNAKIKREDAIYTLEKLLHIIQKGISSGKSLRVFYSWQSDSLNSTNRSFIEKSIEKAIKQINETEKINLYLDQDTRNIPGSPDVIRAILDKINSSLVFIGDVSIVSRSETKAYPNSNVLVEVGYAIKAIGDEKVIMVFNSDSGFTNELPFDLGLKRQMKYNCPASLSPEEKQDERQRLSKDLEAAISTILRLEIG